jgi:hypothetical protein
MRKNKWWLNGGRGSGRTIRLLCEEYENKIADIKANCDLAIEGRDVKIKELKQENEELKNRYDRVDIIGYDALKNLTKAKELLNEFMRISKASDEDFEHDYSELIGEAEKFLDKVK